MRNNLIEFRTKLGMTQTEMGELFKLSRGQWSNIENGRRNGSTKLWLEFQKKFKLDADQTLKLMEVA